MNRHIPFRARWVLSALLLLAPALAWSAEILPATAIWRYFPGRTEASSPDHTAWRAPGFDDTTWASGPAPFFFGKPFSGTELTDMLNQYSSVFLRQTFVVDDPATIGELTLHVLSDDGYIAWLNGREIARYNVPDGELAAAALASPALPEPLAYDEVTVNEPWKQLVAGKNVLAIHAFNAS